MAIDRSEPRHRHGVLFIDADPPPEAQGAFTERGFQVSRCAATELRDRTKLFGVAAVVFVQTAQAPEVTGKQLREYGLRLLDFDCRVFVRPAVATPEHSIDPLPFIENGARQLPVVGLGRRGRAPSVEVPPFPHVRVAATNAPWSELADEVVAHPPGDAPSATLQIDGGDELSESQRTLIRRAFHDCEEVHLILQSEGRSGVFVYRAYAQLSGGLLGAWPLPYFLKVGDRTKVFTEFQNYDGRVDPYVPFHLGPHLVRERCCLGARDGIIVGDFVEESEALSTCASTGRAAAAISCLFDRTLRGWHRHATEQLAWPGLLPSEIPDGRVAAARRFGDAKSLSELSADFAKIPKATMLVGPIHGDLHASNVRVRSADAIVIDFFAARTGPVLRDPATLEASLLVECLTAPNPIDAWVSEIDELYAPRAFERLPPERHPKSSSTWFRACIRQVRMYARDMERANGQYGLILAIALLHKASKSGPQKGDADRRAATYYLGARLLSHFASGADA